MTPEGRHIGYGTFKGSYPRHTVRTFSYETLLKLRIAVKGFIGKIRNL